MEMIFLQHDPAGFNLPAETDFEINAQWVCPGYPIDISFVGGFDE